MRKSVSSRLKRSRDAIPHAFSATDALRCVNFHHNEAYSILSFLRVHPHSSAGTGHDKSGRCPILFFLTAGHPVGETWPSHPCQQKVFSLSVLFVSSSSLPSPADREAGKKKKGERMGKLPYRIRSTRFKKNEKKDQLQTLLPERIIFPRIAEKPAFFSLREAPSKFSRSATMSAIL